ncbi:MAG: iron-containing redox enzyme family protein [Burkholderiaceae bacterium]
MNLNTSSTEVLAALTTAQTRLIQRLSSHPFLIACREGRASHDSLKALLVQQGLYSTHFTRYLCALMANLPSNDQVFELAENLFEELGFAPDSPTPHYILYREMLSAFSLSLEEGIPTAGTRHLIDTMYAHCRERDPAIGLGALCLGAEGLVPALYADFVKGFEALGADAATLRFFHLHMACDDEHAETLARLMVELVERSPDALARIVAAGEALVDARWAFLDDIAHAGKGAPIEVNAG